MDMNWYRIAEYYIEKNEWPARLRPTLREEGYAFEVEKPLWQAGILLIPSDWKQSCIQSNSSDVQQVLTDATKTVLENVTARPQCPTHLSKANCTSLIMYDSSSDRQPKWKEVYCEQDTRKFASLIHGALPHGITLFKHEPKNLLYMYNGEDIWQWSGDLNLGFQIIISELQQHTVKHVLLFWNNDLQRYLVNTNTPRKGILDWETDTDRPNVESLFDKLTDDRKLLAYNNINCLIYTMNLTTAKLAVRAVIRN